MNKMILSMISFSTGAAIGAFVTYKVVSKKVDDIIKAETDEIRDRYTDRLAAVTGSEKKEEDIPKRDRHTEGKPKKLEYVDYTKFADARQKPPLEDLMTELKDPTEEELAEEVEAGIPDPEVVDSEAPYPDYEQIGLFYYMNDDALCDDEDDPLRDRTKFIGDIDLIDLMEKKGLVNLKDGKTDTILIVNHEMKVLFVVTVVKSSYTEEVLGIDDES